MTTSNPKTAIAGSIMATLAPSRLGRAGGQQVFHAHQTHETLPLRRKASPRHFLEVFEEDAVPRPPKNAGCNRMIEPSRSILGTQRGSERPGTDHFT